MASDFLAAFDVLDLAEIPIGNDVLASNAIYAAIAAADVGRELGSTVWHTLIEHRNAPC